MPRQPVAARSPRPRARHATGPPSRWFLAASIAFTCFTAPVSAQGESHEGEAPLLDLEALTRAAARNYPSLRAARQRIEAAEARLDEATISPFFQLQATASFGMAPSAEGTPIFSPDDQLPVSNPWRPVMQAGVEGAIPIYTFGKIRAGRRAARAGVRVAEETQRQAVARLRSDVRRAYFALQLALDVEQMIREGRGRLERAVERLEQRIADGDPDVSSMDRWRLASTLAEVDARASEAARVEAVSTEALRVLTGKERFRIPDCPMERVLFPLRPLEHYVARARGERPEARMLESAIDARSADLEVQQGRFFPDIAVGLRASQSYAPGITNQNNPFIIDSANYRTLGAGLVARWSLDLWGNAYRVRRARAELAETREQAEEARQGIRLEIANAYHEVEDAVRREQAWGRGHRDARTWFVAALQAYDIGTLEPRDLVDAVRAYFLARFNHIQAIRDANTALAELERSTGVPLIPDAGWEGRCPE